MFECVVNVGFWCIWYNDIYYIGIPEVIENEKDFINDLMS